MDDSEVEEGKMAGPAKLERVGVGSADVSRRGFKPLSARMESGEGGKAISRESVDVDVFRGV